MRDEEREHRNFDLRQQSFLNFYKCFRCMLIDCPEEVEEFEHALFRRQLEGYKASIQQTFHQNPATK